MQTNTWRYSITLTFPFRLNIRYFSTPSFFNIGFIIGVYGKCVWLHCLSKHDVDYIYQKENLEIFNSIMEQLQLKK
jgi:hypothetical protein